MAKSKRMFNSNIVNASSFKMKISNKAKLLYFYIMLNADDRGFCDNADEIIVLLDSNDVQFHNEASLDLVEHGYKSAIQELVEKHLLLVFQNKYEDKVYLVRQWYLHNQIPKDRVTETTYIKYLEQVAINSENEYDLIQKPKSMPKTSKKVDLVPINDIQEIQESEEGKINVDRSYDIDEDSEKEDDYDYSIIPDKWDIKATSRAVSIHVKKIKGEQITSEQEAYLNAYTKTSKKENEKIKKADNENLSDNLKDDLPF